MKIYIVVRYIEREKTILGTFTDKDLAKEFVNCHSGHVFIEECELYTTLPCRKIYHVRYDWDECSTICGLPESYPEIQCFFEEPELHCGYYEPYDEIDLFVNVLVTDKKIGDNFAKLCNQIKKKANKMHKDGTPIEEITQFVEQTIRPTMEEIRVKH